MVILYIAMQHTHTHTHTHGDDIHHILFDLQSSAGLQNSKGTLSFRICSEVANYTSK